MAAQPYPPKLTEGSLWSALGGLALPALGSNLLQSLSGSVSTLWVGRLLGPAALTATANAHLILGLTTSLLGGVATAAGLLVGRAIGEGDGDRAQSVVGSSLTAVLTVSAVVAALGYVAAPGIVDTLAVPRDAEAAAVVYLQLLFATMPVINVLAVLMALLQGAGDARTPMVATAVLVGADAVAAPLLIRGIGAWHGWGIAGAGIAYGLSHALGLAALWLFAVRRPNGLALASAVRLAHRPNLSIVRQSLGGGTLVGLHYALIYAASLALMGLVNPYGSATAAAYAVAVTIWSYVQMPIQSVAGATSAIAAQSVGASLHHRVRQAAWVGSAANVALTGVTVAMCYGLNEPMVKLFLPGQPDAAAIATEINATVLWSFLLMAVTMVLFAVLRAVDDLAVPFAVILVSHGAVRVPFAYLLAPEYGPTAIWWSYPVGLAVALVATLIYVAWRPPWARNRARRETA